MAKILQNSNKISESLLLAVKMKQETAILTSSLEKISLEKLQNDLNNDDTKKAFWINIYALVGDNTNKGVSFFFGV